MKFRFLYFVIVTFLLLSCNKKERIASEIEMLSKQSITFVDGFVELPCNSDVKLDSLLKKNVKIVSYLTDISCTSCGVKTLKIWQEELQKIDKRVVPVIVVHSTNQEFRKMTDSLSLDLPLMYYDSKIFGEKNNLEEVLARNRTLLLNKENEIILVGEPIGRDKLTQLYKKCIDSLFIDYYGASQKM